MATRYLFVKEYILSLSLCVSLCRLVGLAAGILFICLHRMHGVAVSMAMCIVQQVLIQSTAGTSLQICPN